MKAIKSSKELMADGRQLEQVGQWESAAEIYQGIMDENPANRDAVRRLLMVYRKLKDFRKELSIINAALGAVAQRDKTAQAKWLAANPQSAKLGKAILKSLGGEQVTAYGTDSFVEQLLKRKGLVERKIDGEKKGRGRSKKRAGKGQTSKDTARPMGNAKKLVESTLRVATRVKGDSGNAAADKKRREAAVKKAEQKAAAEEKKRKEAAAKKAAVEQRRQAAAEAKKEETERRKAEKVAAAIPSLFVISIHYLASLEKIDVAMSEHVAFLDKHFSSGMFLMAGRQVPRTGGVIIAQGKDRAGIEGIMRQDPFIKGRLARMDIVEFKASKATNSLQGLFKVRRRKG